MRQMNITKVILKRDKIRKKGYRGREDVNILFEVN